MLLRIGVRRVQGENKLKKERLPITLLRAGKVVSQIITVVINSRTVGFLTHVGHCLRSFWPLLRIYYSKIMAGYLEYKNIPWGQIDDSSSWFKNL